VCQSANRKSANFHGLSANRRFLEFLQNTAQHRLKTVLKVAFTKQFFILYFELQYCFLYLQGENVCICGLAELEVRKSQKYVCPQIRQVPHLRRVRKAYKLFNSASLQIPICGIYLRIAHLRFLSSLPSGFFVLICPGLPYIFRDRLTGPYLRWDGRKTIPQGSKPYCYTV
jgi:hypothetical protein